MNNKKSLKHHQLDKQLLYIKSTDKIMNLQKIKIMNFHNELLVH